MRIHVSRETVVALGIVALLGIAVVARSRQASRDTGAACCQSLTASELAEPLPVDSTLRSGTLGNGMHYYVLENGSPTGRAELRLAVNAGSVLETDDQRGLAHGVEHMVFRGTTLFPGRAIDSYFLSVGMRLGQDLNAYTGPDQTVYSITVPTDRPGVLDTAVAILAQMAFAATFDSSEARTESGIVFEEWRSTRGSSARFADQRDGLLLAGSQYALRHPIGDTAVIRKFDVRQLRQFYDEWYRPDLMALSVVGDFNVNDVQRLVKKHFGDVRARSSKIPRPSIPVSIPVQARAATLTDVEATDTRVSLWFPRDAIRYATVGDYRDWLVSAEWRHILADRLEDVSDLPGSPLLSTSVDARHLVRPLSADVMTAAIAEGRASAAVDLLMTEVARLAQHGPTERQLQARATAMKKDAWRNTQWNRSSDVIADDYSTLFLTSYAVLDPGATYDAIARIVPTIKASDIQLYAQRVLADSGVLVLLTQPTARAAASETPASLAAAMKNAATRVVPRVNTENDSLLLVANVPSPGTIVSETPLRDIGAFDLRLSNGMRVILKPTDFSNDQVVFHLSGPGGASLASAANYASAYMSDDVVESTGVGELNGIHLSRLLSSSTLDFSRFVSDDAIGFNGDLAPRDLTQLFQLIHLNFTAARSDTVAFRRYRERVLADRAHRDLDPDALFEDSATAIATQHDKRMLTATQQFFNGVKFPDALAFWNSRTSNAAGFTLVMVGDFALAQVRPLIAQYLASLPAGVVEQPRDDGVRFPTTTVVRTIAAGVGPRARTRITLAGAIAYTAENSDALSIATDAAELALGNVLREKMGGTYNVSVQAGARLLPPTAYRITIDFEAAPERIDSLATAAINELQRLSAVGPTHSEFETIRTTKSRDLDNTSESNRYWASELLEHARFGWSLSSIKGHQQQAKDLTEIGVRAACHQFLSPAQFTRLTMVPKAPIVTK